MEGLRSRASTRHFVDGDVDEKSPWFPEYQGRELEFAADILGLRHKRTKRIAAWAAQRYIFEALFKYKRVAVYGARGVGKDFIASYILPTFFYTAPSRILTTGPGLRHVKYVLWSEVRKVMAQSVVPLQGDLGMISLNLDARHYALGIPSKDPNAIRGWHADPMMGGDPDADCLTVEDLEEAQFDDLAGTRLLLIIDEPQGLQQEVFDIFRGMFNKDNVYCLMIGNPALGLEDDHEYVHTLTRDIGFHRIKVSWFSEEQFPDPNQHRYDKIFEKVPETFITAKAKKEALKRFEPNDPLFMSDCLGQFTSGSIEQKVVTSAILRAAMAMLQTIPRRDIGPRIGIDIGTGSPDPCTAALFFNGVKRAAWEWRPPKDDQQTRVTTATEIAALMVDWGRQLHQLHPDEWDGSPITGERVSIDDTANPGVCDILSSKGILTDRVNFSQSPDGQWPELRGNFRFPNKRVEMHWLARCGLQEGYFAIDPEQFPKSAEEACWARYQRETTGMGTMIIVELKKDIKKRHGRSPDHWDADILAMRSTGTESFADTFGDPHTGRRSNIGLRAAQTRSGWRRMT